MKEAKAVNGETILKHFGVVIDALSKAWRKATKRRGSIPAAEIAVMAALLEQAKDSARDGGYSEVAIEAWTDVGERMYDAKKNNRGFSQGDEEAFVRAYQMPPANAERLEGYQPLAGG